MESFVYNLGCPLCKSTITVSTFKGAFPCVQTGVVFQLLSCSKILFTNQTGKTRKWHFWSKIIGSTLHEILKEKILDRSKVEIIH